MTTQLVRDIQASSAERVLVVTGYKHLLQNLSPELFDRRNRERYFGWLLKVCEYLRHTDESAVLVSPYPRYWNPPRIRVVQAAGFVAHADGSVPGERVELSASTLARFMRSGTAGTLSVSRLRNNTLAIYFYGVYADSYYREVVASQHEAQITTCKVISGPADTNVWTPEKLELEASVARPERQTTILRDVCRKWEQQCCTSELAKENPQYVGALLLPTMPFQHALPAGAREGAPVSAG